LFAGARLREPQRVNEVAPGHRPARRALFEALKCTTVMATQKETVEFLLAKLRQPKRFSARAMFGEYALYADGKSRGADLR